ncbi:MAG: hypothetical protein AABX34_03415 [Nanoarchaeota archaeon]
MSNDDLVEIVRRHQYYQEYHSPEFDKVLEAMLRVDRKDFLPEEVPVEVTVDYHESRLMYDARMVLVDDGKTTDDKVKALEAMLKYMDKLFSSPTIGVFNPRDSAYENKVLDIGHGQACSQPSLVAFMAYLLELEKGMKVFELGYGCGYSAAITYHLIRPSGHLVAAEIIDELAELGRNNLETHLGKVGVKSKGWKLFDMMGQLLSREEKVKLISGNGLEVLEKEAPFDRIYLTAGVDLESFDPSKLATHLNPKGGILLFPEERGDLIKQLYKGGNLIDTKRYGDGRILFVPLTGINS